MRSVGKAQPQRQTSIPSFELVDLGRRAGIVRLDAAQDRELVVDHQHGVGKSSAGRGSLPSGDHLPGQIETSLGVHLRDTGGAGGRRQ